MTMTTKPEIEDVALSSINVDGFTQTREFMDHDVVHEYQDAYQSGAKLPPVVLFEDGKTLWVGDGFHRIEAAMGLGLEKIAAEIHTGGRVDALRYALGANANHGLRRTTGDLNQAVVMAWESREELGLGKNPSARLIAELVKVSPTTAMKHLRNATGYDPDAVRTGADGKEYPAASRRSEEPRVQPSEARNGPAVVEMDLEKDAEESSEQEAHGFVWNQFGVCQNPFEVILTMPKGTSALLTMARTPSGMCVYGYDLNINGVGTGCGGCGAAPSRGGKKFDTQLDAAEAFLDFAQGWFARSNHPMGAKAAQALLAAKAVEKHGVVYIDMGEPEKAANGKKMVYYKVVADLKCHMFICADSEDEAKEAIAADDYRLLLEKGDMFGVEISTWHKIKEHTDGAGVIDVRKGGAK
jgi:hypothetical protein